MILRTLQKSLEDVYGLKGLPHIEHFILQKDSVVTLQGHEHDPSPQVMIQEDHNEVFLGVYLGDQLTNGNLDKKTEDLALDDFCEIAEEVSHFIYLSWSAQNAKPRSLLDLELQAEVDKWILSHLLRPHEEKSLSTLFHAFTLRENLREHEQNRYLEANRLAVKFLKHHFQSQFRFLQKKLEMLRHFYRSASSLRIAQLHRL